MSAKKANCASAKIGADDTMGGQVVSIHKAVSIEGRAGLGKIGILLAVGAYQVGIESQRPGCPLHQLVSADPLTPCNMHHAAGLVLRQADQGPRRSCVVERGPEFIFEEDLRFSRSEACQGAVEERGSPGA